MSTSNSPELELVHRVINYIEENVEDSPTLADISQHVHVSQFHLQRTFKKVMGITPRQYAEAYRLETLKSHLRDGSNVTRALYAAGYGSSSRLYENTHKQLGMTPAEYRNGGEGMVIQYTIVDCKLGRLLIGTTERGVCAVHLGDPSREDCDLELEAVLFAEYPQAIFHRNRNQLCEWAEEIIDQLNGWEPRRDLPLDIRATSFQLRVWEELRKIPYGETRTYQEIAEAIGQPKATSAVARAVHSNPVAIIIPCHRARCKDGTISAYYSRRSKVARKKLLEHEQEVVHQRQPQV
ncbi:MAG TPA: methylated-DNA--[protein]-cysteine S-methyltransferase [Oceanobacillus sp.]|nr:methylated-DNA--[protein]-cysteine S-methyltransferase [Oceanobacillus sp.]